jgi:hypothetical protein
MNTLSFLLDISGRVTKKDILNNYIIVACVIFPTSDKKKLRIALSNSLPKWRDATPESLSLIANVLYTHSIGSVALKIEKKQPAWSDFWTKGNNVHRSLTSTLNEKFGLMRPGSVLKHRFLQSGAAIALESHIKHYGIPELLDQYGQKMLRLEIICDSDIQGDESKDFFRENWEKWTQTSQFLKSLRIGLCIDQLEFQTEENEPLLLLPDYLAGYVQFNTNPKTIALPEKLRINHVKKFAKELTKIKTYNVVTRPFDDIYPNIKTK